MAPEPENLLESEQIEDVLEQDGPPDVLEQDGPPPPVVVVQNRNRVLPGLLIVGSIVVLALGSAFAYREVVRLRKQAELAQRDLQRAIEQARVEENERRLASLPPPPIIGPPEVAATSSGRSDLPGALAVGGMSTRPQESGPSPSPQPEASGTSPSGGPTAPTPSGEAGRPDSGSPAPRPKVLTQLIGGADPASTPGPGPAVSGRAANSKPPITAAESPATSPFDDLNNGGEPGRGPAPGEGAAPASASMVAEKAGAPTPADSALPVAMPAEPPLPSREETERQILEEAAAIKQDRNQQLEQQREDLQGLRDDERRQFLDELRMILKVQGRMAGQEIERLSNRTGRTEDPRLLIRARVVIGENRISQHAKVRRLREFGVPETVILDYLANALNKDLGARNGPRTRNEVWIRAGKLLLKYYDDDAPRPADPPAAGGRPAVPPAAPAGQPADAGTPRTR
jgi:type II secretory pathway pseudopilin PulG